MGDWPSHPVCGLHVEELGVAEGRFIFGADPRQRDPDSELLLYLHPDEVVALPTVQGSLGVSHVQHLPPHGLQSQCHCLLLLPHIFKPGNSSLLNNLTQFLKASSFLKPQKE